MINSKILASVLIVLIIGVAAAGYQISQTPELWQQITSPNNLNPAQQDGDVSGASGNGAGSYGGTASGGNGQGSGQGSTGGSKMMTASQAKNLAQNKHISLEGAIAGTPKLTTYAGRKAYYVPILINGTRVGEIYIDAITGEDLGGAGGVR